MRRVLLVGCGFFLGALVACGPTWINTPDSGAGPRPDGAVALGDAVSIYPDGSVLPRPDGAAPGPDAAPPGPDAAPPGPDAAPPGPDGGGGPISGPGTNVVWLSYGAQNSQTDGSWGTVLTDIVQHCPSQWVNIYWDSDKVTHGHETSHGIHANLRNNYNNTGGPANGFYVLWNQAAIVAEPNLYIHDVAPYVPVALRGFRYSLYLQNSPSWDDTPLYVWDEWNSYVNGTEVAVDLANAGMWSYGWRDACMGTVEFVVYAIAVGMAARDLDASYFTGYPQFTEFLAWNLRRSLDLFRACRVISDFAWTDQDVYYNELQTGSSAAPFRQFLVQTYGQTFATDVLDL
jgi:hypothetical protein